MVSAIFVTSTFTDLCPMKTEEILETILQIATDVLKRLPENTGTATRFSEIPLWNSLNHAFIINSIEKQYGIEFDLDEMIECETLGDICGLVSKKSGI